MTEKYSKHLLEYLTLGYLALPIAIFFFTWVSPILAFLLIYALVKGLQQWRASDNFFCLNEIKYSPNKSNLQLSFLASGIVIIWVTLSGAGGLSFQNWDYLKHNAILGDLVGLPWPVSYPNNGGNERLVYYLGYYLPAAVVGKIGGWNAALLFQYFWTLAGAMFGLLWFKKLSGAHQDFLVAILFISFGGLDLLGRMISQMSFHMPFFGEHIEHWTRWGYSIYSSNTTSLFWAPQHAIPTWLATFLVLKQWHSPQIKDLVFLFSITIFWSPFIALGILPFCFLAIYNAKCLDFSEAHKIKIIWPGVIISFTFALFFKSRNGGLNLGSIWEDNESKKILLQTLIVFICEFGIYSILLLRLINKKHKLILFTAILTLIGAGLIKSDHYNDFTMRVSQPALMVISLFVTRALTQYSFASINDRPNLIILIMALIVGSASSMQEISRTFIFNRKVIKQPATHKVLLLKPGWLPRQYLGSKDSFFFKYIADEKRK